MRVTNAEARLRLKHDKLAAKQIEENKAKQPLKKKSEQYKEIKIINFICPICTKQKLYVESWQKTKAKGWICCDCYCKAMIWKNNKVILRFF